MKYKCQNMIRLIFQNELILIKQMHQKSVVFITIGIFQIKILNMNHIFIMVVMIYCKKTMNFNDVAVVSIKRSGYKIHFWNMSEDDAINIMINSNLNEKSELL